MSFIKTHKCSVFLLPVTELAERTQIQEVCTSAASRAQIPAPPIASTRDATLYIQKNQHNK